MGGTLITQEPGGKLMELEGLTAALAADGLDQLGRRHQTMDPAIVPLHPGARIVGRAVPFIACRTDEMPEEPYKTEMRALDSLKPGDVPVYAVEPDVRAALWGELFSHAARGRGAVGAIVDGYVRDSHKIDAIAYPVFCRGRSPLDTRGRAEVTEFAVEAICGGVLVRPGDWIVADFDGVVVVPQETIPDLATLVSKKARDEHGARGDLIAGAGLQAVWDKWRVL